MMRREEAAPHAVEFRARQAHYASVAAYHSQREKLAAMVGSKSAAATSRLAPHLAVLTPALHSLQRHLSAQQRAAAPPLEEPAPYRSPLPVDEAREERRVALMHNLTSLEQVPTMHQRLNSPTVDILEPPMPIRTLLRAKIAKRCRTCDRLLIKPDPKATSTKFKVKHVALSYLPNVTLAHPVPLLVHRAPCTLLLRFTNPTDDDMHLTLESLDSLTAQVVVVCRQFSIPARDPSIEWFDAPAQHGAHGVVCVQANSVVVEVLVTPLGRVGSPVEFEVIMSYMYTPPPAEATSTALSPLRSASRASHSTEPQELKHVVSINAGGVASDVALS